MLSTDTLARLAVIGKQSPGHWEPKPAIIAVLFTVLAQFDKNSLKIENNPQPQPGKFGNIPRVKRPERPLSLTVIGTKPFRLSARLLILVRAWWGCRKDSDMVQAGRPDIVRHVPVNFSRGGESTRYWQRGRWGPAACFPA